MNLNVREANLSDEADQAAFCAMLKMYYADPFGGDTPIPPGRAETAAQDLSEHPTAVVFLAFHGDSPVGYTLAFMGYSSFAAKPLLNLHDVAVVPEARGQGVGRALLDTAESYARDAGCVKLTLEVLDDNDRARSLYRKVGFEDQSLRFWAKTL